MFDMSQQSQLSSDNQGGVHRAESELAEDHPHLVAMRSNNEPMHHSLHTIHNSLSDPMRRSLHETGGLPSEQANADILSNEPNRVTL